MSKYPYRVFSYTAIRQFEKCPRQYQEVRLLKKFPSQQTEEAAWGEYVHKCLENAIKDGTPLPNNVSQYQPLLDGINQRREQGWTIKAEQTFAIANNNMGELIDSTQAKGLWVMSKYRFAGNIDLLMTSPDGKQAVIVDWKTNKSARYAEPQQIELYALGVMLALPEVEHVSGCLMFVCDHYKMVKSTFTRNDVNRLLSIWSNKTQRIMLAMINDNFPDGEATPLCGWCPCSECPNWQQGQDFRERRRKK